MPPSALDSTVNPCLEYVKYPKPCEIIQRENGCAKERQSTQKDVEKKTGERAVKEPKVAGAISG